MSDTADLENLREEAKAEFAQVLADLQRDHPKVVEGAAAVVGGAVGGSAALTALYYAGRKGFSAPGITSGLKTVGGGRMVGGVGALSALVAVLAVGGYAIAKRRRSAKLAAALRTAIERLHQIQERLAANAEYFRAELAEIKAYIDNFESKMP